MAELAILKLILFVKTWFSSQFPKIVHVFMQKWRVPWNFLSLNRKTSAKFSCESRVFSFFCPTQASWLGERVIKYAYVAYPNTKYMYIN